MPAVGVAEVAGETPLTAYSDEQLANAREILRAGQALEVSVRDQAIAVMVAMGESSLRALDYGDTVGPDSRGLFQQRDNGAWGTYEDRMDPFTSATNFLVALQGVEQRASLTPSHAGHRVQRNADPEHYAPYWPGAVELVKVLSQTQLNLNTDPNVVCSGASTIPGTVLDSGWAVPSAGDVTSGFGQRLHPVSGDWRLHAGTDFGAQCGAPIWAARDGAVIQAGMDPAGTGIIRIDHGGGVETRYLHSYADGIYVQPGQVVTAGQHIAAVGSSGPSTGCHLHFEIRVNGSPIDPEVAFEQLGAPLR